MAAAPCPRSTPLEVRTVELSAIPRDTWDAVLAATPHATPFSRWTFHRAWWDAYGDNAEAHYLVCCRPDTDAIVGIAPLMIRVVPGGARTLFMAASYHADYATILCDPSDLPAVADAVACDLVRNLDGACEAVDLRRLRREDPTARALADAVRTSSPGSRFAVEQEDVCPIVSLPADGDWETYLATLDKKARHEVRRKLRRAEGVGPVRFRQLPLASTSADAFIELHQARWGPQGLFPDTTDGDRSRRFLHRLTELEAAEGPDAQLMLGEVAVGDRIVFAAVAFDDGETCFFYNAGMDPTARELSPGVTGTAAFIRDRLDAGRTRFDFLRGDEAYKYEWGAVDEPVDRVAMTRS